MSCSDVEYDAMKSDGEFDADHMTWSENEFDYMPSEPKWLRHMLSQPKHKRTAFRRKSTSASASASASSVSVSSGPLPEGTTSSSSDDDDDDDDDDSVYRGFFNAKPAVSQSGSRSNPLLQPITKPADHISPSISSNTPVSIASPPQEEKLSCGCGDMSQHMDPEMYRIVTSGSLAAFWRLLQANFNKTQSLLSQEVVWRQVTPQGNTILHLAAASGNLQMVRMILQNKQDLKMATNFIGDLPLHVASRAGHLPAVKELLITIPSASGQSSNVLKEKNGDGDTALHLALRKHHQGVAEFLVQQDPQASYILNKDEISPLYMAAEAGYHQIVNLMMDDNTSASSDHRNPNGQLKGKSLVHAALISKNEEILSTILKKEPTLIDSRNEQGMSPMFFAASTGYVNGVRKLIDHSTKQAYQRHQSGLFPIHIASYKGNIDIVSMFLDRCPDSMELLVQSNESKKRKERIKQSGQNILHLAAKGGRAQMVSYLLEMDDAESLINHKDLRGNTPLHLAAMNWHPKIVSILTWDTRANFIHANNDGFTALDIVERVSTLSTYRQRLTWMALLSAGTPRANLQSSTPKIPSNVDKYNNRINTLLLMATLVATVTYAAGFTMPGGNASNPDQKQQQGMANLGTSHMFQVFVTCDTIALYSSIVVAVILIWAQQSDLYLVSTAFKFALPLLGITLTSMSLAFMAGVYLVVSNVKWLANFVLIMGLVFLASFLVLFVPLFLPYQSRTRIIRRIVYYPFCLMVLITCSDKR